MKEKRQITHLHDRNKNLNSIAKGERQVNKLHIRRKHVNNSWKIQSLLIANKSKLNCARDNRVSHNEKLVANKLFRT